MALNVGGITSYVISWFGSIFFWFAVAIILVVGFGIILMVRKKRTLKFTALELTFLKEGKVVIEWSNAGWFGKKSAFFGFFNYGRQKVMKLADGREIREFSVDDYHELRRKGKAKRCILVTSHPEDKTMVVLLSRSSLDPTTLEAIYEIAPADYRDSAVDSFNESVNELKGTMDRMMPYILLGGIVIFFIIGIIINGQLVSKAVDSATMMLADAGDTLENIAQLVSSRPSTAP